MTPSAQTDIRWWPRLGDLPRNIFPPGWLAFGLRTWAALCLALAVTFWAQIDAPAGAAVTVMILAQPLRGQALSKAFYRLLGTFAGVCISILLISMFSQDRGMLLGGCAIWLALCAYIGTLERDFRSYAALLAGYTVGLVAINVVDTPQNVFSVAISRASSMGIGVASIAVVNLLSGSPHAWRKLTDAMQSLAQRIRHLGYDALMGEPTPEPMETTALAAEILSLSTQISYARTEVDRSRLRTAGARLAIIGMLTVLTCSRAISAILKRGRVSTTAIRHVREWHERAEDGTDREHTIAEMLTAIRNDEPDYTPSLDDAYFLERSATLLSNRLHIRTGINTLQHATPAGDALKLARLGRQPDYVSAFVNALRVLVGFSLTAGLCIASDLPASSGALAQTALILTLASTVTDTAQFGIGAIIGLFMGVGVAAWLNYWVLPHISDMGALTLIFLPQTLFACLLMMNPKTNAIGFNYGAFFPIILGIGNHHAYDPVAFISRNIFLLLSGVTSFIILVLIFPPSARSRRLRVATTIGRDLEKQLRGTGEPLSPSLHSRTYDRLAQALNWTRRIGSSGSSPRLVFERLVSLEDFANTLARARSYLDTAQNIPTLRHATLPARRALDHDRLGILHDEIPALAHAFLKDFDVLTPHEQAISVICVGGLQAVCTTLEQLSSVLRFYGIGRARW